MQNAGGDAAPRPTMKLAERGSTEDNGDKEALTSPRVCPSD